MNIKLTPKQTALLTAIGRSEFSFFDDGVAAGSGIWSEVLTGECGPEIAANPKGAARVAGSLVKKGLLASFVDAEENDTWFELTEAGAELANELAATQIDLTPVAEVEEEPAQTELDLDDLADLIGETVEEEELDVTEENRFVVGEGDEPFVAKETDEDGTEWTRTTFEDGSYTLKRRRQVSGAWRTDYWGCESGSDKEVFCLSRDAKAALAAGSFASPLI